MSKVKVDTIRPRVGTQIDVIGGLSANNEIIAPSIIGVTLSAGGLIYGDAANMTNTGGLLQVVNSVYNDPVTLSTTTYGIKTYEQSITTTATNSKILVELIGVHSSYNVNKQLVMAMGYKTGATSADIDDYSSVLSSSLNSGFTELPDHNNFFTRDTGYGINSTWANSQMPTFFCKSLHSPSQTLGTVINYTLLIASIESGTHYLGRAYYSANTAVSTSFTLTEIAG